LQYITADWGIATHLICEAKKGTRVEETWWRFNSIKDDTEFLCSKKGNFYIAGHHDTVIEIKSTKPETHDILDYPEKFNAEKVFEGKVDIILKIKNKE
jgi:hypothetical protein